MANAPLTNDESEDQRLSRVLDEVPKGALALSFLAVVLLLVGWFFVYFFIFIPRGTVG